MASTQSAKAVNLIAGEDLNGDVYEIVTINSSGQVVKSSLATDVIAGVVAEDPGRVTIAGADSVPVAIVGGGGVLKMKAGTTITAGNLIVSHGATTAGTVAGVANTGALAVDQMAIGVALEAATAAGDIIEVLVMPIAAPHTA